MAGELGKCRGRGCTNDADKILDVRHPDGHWLKLPTCESCRKKLLEHPEARRVPKDGKAN